MVKIFFWSQNVTYYYENVCIIIVDEHVILKAFQFPLKNEKIMKTIFIMFYAFFHEYYIFIKKISKLFHMFS
jgi:hypothetical protein